MRYLKLILSTLYRTFYGIGAAFEGNNAYHRSDYWGGDDQGVAAEKLRQTETRQNRNRRKRFKRIDDIERDNETEI